MVPDDCFYVYCVNVHIHRKKKTAKFLLAHVQIYSSCGIKCQVCKCFLKNIGVFVISQSFMKDLKMIRFKHSFVVERLKDFRINKRNDKRFNNCSYSLFLLMGIFLKHLWLIPNILKWQDCKIFTKLVPSQTPSRSSHWRCSVKKVFLKICKISQ